MRQAILLDAQDLGVLLGGGELHLTVGGSEITLARDGRDGRAPLSPERRHGNRYSTPSRDALLKAMAEMGGVNLRVLDIATHLRITRERCQSIVSHAREGGHIVRVERGRYSLKKGKGKE